MNVAVGDGVSTRIGGPTSPDGHETFLEVDLHPGPLSVLVDAQNDEQRYLLWKFPGPRIGRTSCDVNLNGPDVSRQRAVVEKWQQAPAEGPSLHQRHVPERRATVRAPL
ncbi:MAG: hypothetical protein U0166_03660 [Acidobacteriota bacterium]